MTYSGQTPLHNATLNANLNTISFFINHKCDVTIKNKHGKTAKDLALDKKQQKVADYFEQDKRVTYGTTAILADHFISFRGD